MESTHGSTTALHGKSVILAAGSAATGVSCRQQIEHLSGRRARHPAQLLRDSLDT